MSVERARALRKNQTEIERRIWRGFPSVCVIDGPIE
jgi:very-short-patch-repair endonuclease